MARVGDLSPELSAFINLQPSNVKASISNDIDSNVKTKKRAVYHAV